MTDSETRLIARLKDTEDALVERKRSATDREEIREAVVAFANSVVAPDTGVLFLGVERDGTPSGTIADADDAQRSVTKFLQRCYPPVRYQLFALAVDRKHVLAVEVPESADLPHFTGKATVRIGSETKDATPDMYKRLLDDHSSKTRLLRRHIGKRITFLQQQQHGNVTVPPRWPDQEANGTLKDVTAFWVVWHVDSSQPPRSAPLERVALSWNTMQSCLRLHIYL